MTDQDNEARSDYSTARLTQRYRFADPNMDLFFLGALGWGPAGGLSVGEAFHVASQIEDGNADSWSRAFERQGEALNVQADAWLERGCRRAAGEARLKAFACYRSAWQFVAPGERFTTLFRTSQRHFDLAITELGLAAQPFAVSYGGGELPGHFFPANDPAAPTILIIGGADTCHEDRFLSQGRSYLDRGYGVALVDLPGQGLVAEQGLHWEPDIERSIGAVINELVARFGVNTQRLAMLGMSLGGYFACRAAAEEPRLAAVVATPALSRPEELFLATAEAMERGAGAASDAARRNMQVLLWKAGVDDLRALADKWQGVAADASKVKAPFLTVVGAQEGTVWQRQSAEWHEAISSPNKRFAVLGAETGADAHCQGNNPLRLVQEVDAWLREIF
jgi:pimeloyl-ACP methyl ester carboxylesterase